MKVRNAYDLARMATDSALGRAYDPSELEETLVLTGKGQGDFALLCDAADKSLRLSRLESQLDRLARIVEALALVVAQGGGRA